MYKCIQCTDLTDTILLFKPPLDGEINVLMTSGKTPVFFRIVYLTLLCKSFFYHIKLLNFVPQMYRRIYIEILEQIPCTTAPEFSSHEGEFH